MARVRALQTIKHGSKWHVPGTPSEVFDMPDALLEKYEGALEVLGGSSAPAEVTSGELPEDFPARDLLIGAGHTTLTAVAGVGDLTSIKGIGKKTAEAIMEALG